MNIEDIKKPENIVYKKTPILTDNVMHYCPGCSHGTVHKLIAEVIEEMGIQDKTIAISPVGCSAQPKGRRRNQPKQAAPPGGEAAPIEAADESHPFDHKKSTLYGGFFVVCNSHS